MGQGGGSDVGIVGEREGESSLAGWAQSLGGASHLGWGQAPGAFAGKL